MRVRAHEQRHARLLGVEGGAVRILAVLAEGLAVVGLGEWRQPLGVALVAEPRVLVVKLAVQSLAVESGVSACCELLALSN